MSLENEQSSPQLPPVPVVKLNRTIPSMETDVSSMISMAYRIARSLTGVVLQKTLASAADTVDRVLPEVPD